MSASSIVDTLGVSAVVLTFLCFFLLHVVDGNWDNFAPSSCITSGRGCFCERPRDGLVRQPSNTYSNLAFTICGAIAMSKGYKEIWRRKERPSRQRNPGDARNGVGKRTIGVDVQIDGAGDMVKARVGEAFIVVFGLSCIILGFGSGLLHASLTLVGQILDYAGMYVVIVACGTFSWTSIKLEQRPRRQSSLLLPHHRLYVDWFLWSLLTLGFKVAMQTFNLAKFATAIVGRFYFFFLIAVAFFLEVYARRVCYMRAQQGRLFYFFAAAGTFALAFGIWLLDILRIVCYPDSLFQGHALWHILDGLAAYFLYLYYLPIALDLDVKKDVKERDRLIGINCGCSFQYQLV